MATRPAWLRSLSCKSVADDDVVRPNSRCKSVADDVVLSLRRKSCSVAADDVRSPSCKSVAADVVSSLRCKSCAAAADGVRSLSCKSVAGDVMHSLGCKSCAVDDHVKGSAALPPAREQEATTMSRKKKPKPAKQQLTEESRPFLPTTELPEGHSSGQVVESISASIWTGDGDAPTAAEVDALILASF